jgi:hypothetical protein
MKINIKKYYLDLIKISAQYDLFNVENSNDYFIENENPISEENSIKYPVSQTTEL